MPPPSRVDAVVLHREALEDHAHAAVLEAAAVGARLVVLDQAVAQQVGPEVVDREAAALLGRGVVGEGRAGDRHRAAFRVQAAAARGVRREDRRVRLRVDLGNARLVVREHRVRDRHQALAARPRAAALVLRLVLREGRAENREARPAFAEETAAGVVGEVVEDLDVGQRHVAVAVRDDAAAGGHRGVPRHEGVRDLDLAAQPDLARLAAAVEAAAVAAERLVLRDLAVLDGHVPARAVDAAAGRRRPVLRDGRALEDDRAAAAVEEARAVVVREVAGDRRVRDLDRALDVELRLVRDRRRVGLVDAGGGDELDLLARDLRLRRVRDHQARVVDDLAAGDGDVPGARVVDRRAAAAGRVALEDRVDDLEAAGAGRRRRLDDPRVLGGLVVVDAAADLPGEAVLHHDVLEARRALVPVLDAGAALVGVRLAQREVLEEDVARVRVDLEEAVHPALLDGRALERPAGVDDGEGHARALDRHRVRDVVVTGRAGVLVQRRDLELVDAGRDLDDLPTAECVRLHDRGAQGAVPARRRTVPVAGAAVGLVERARDEELGAVRGERARQAGGRDDDDDRGDGGGPDVPPSKPPAVCVVGLLLPARTPEQSPEIPNAPGPPPQLKRLPAVGFPA